MKKIIIAILTMAFSFSANARTNVKANLKTSSKKHQSVAKKSAQNNSLKDEFKTLGDNKVFAERVKQMDQRQRVRIVENRIVDLHNRFEIAGTYAYSAGGDSYVTTQSLGGILDFHFSPKFAMGVRYQHYYNELTNEGKDQYGAARAAQALDSGSKQEFAGVDFPKDMGLLTVSYSPIYGKLNLFDMSVAHFDVYTLAGYGKMQLETGTSDVFAGGLGMGIWITQNFSARLEGRYESYKDFIGTENRSQSNIQGLVAIGILL